MTGSDELIKTSDDVYAHGERYDTLGYQTPTEWNAENGCFKSRKITVNDRKSYETLGGICAVMKGTKKVLYRVNDEPKDLEEQMKILIDPRGEY